MAQVKGVVEGVSTKFGKYSIMVDGNWYGTKMEWAKVQPSKGDEVEFDDGGGKFLKNVKILKGSSGAPAKGGDRPAFNTLGVELGHAANLAMQVTLAEFGKMSTTSEEKFYKFFVDQTETIFKVMKAIRSSHEKSEDSASELAAKIEAPKKISDEDLF